MNRLIQAFAVALISIGATLLSDPAVSAPRQIPHAYGTTQVDGTPQRVVSLSFIGHDFLLALGVAPIALRNWYGNHPFGVWPWAQDALGEAQPQVLYGEINIEQIALLEPDLIVGQWSGMTRAEYDLLSRIAPTLPHPAGEQPYSASWQQMTLQLGRVLDRTAQANAVVNRLNARFRDIRDRHPDWQGAQASATFAPRLSVYSAYDLRGQFLQDLGFVLPPELDRLTSFDTNFIRLDQENIGVLDSDIMIWMHASDINAQLDTIVLRPTLRGYREGREIYTDHILSAALSHSSPLSLDYALDRMEPLIEAAIDGDPTTLVPGWTADKRVAQP